MRHTLNIDGLTFPVTLDGEMHTVNLDDTTVTADITGDDPPPPPPPSNGGGMSLKALEDATHTVYAAAPSPESGLAAIDLPDDINQAVDEAPKIQAMLDYVKATYGAGRIVFPTGGKARLDSGIVIPPKVQVEGFDFWFDFWWAPTSVTAVKVHDDDFTPLVGIGLHGGQWEANTPNHNTTTSTGIDVHGQGLNFDKVKVDGFNTGVDFRHDDTFLVNFHQSVIRGCMLAIDLDIENFWHPGTPAVGNSGERMTFTDCVIANCGLAYQSTSNGVGLNFTNTSIDFCARYGRQRNSHTTLTSSHLEGGGYPWGTNDTPWLFDLDVNSRLYLSNCLFIFGIGGRWMLCKNQGPWNTTWGMAHVSQCYASFPLSPAAQTAQTFGTAYSEALAPVPEGATQVVVASFFLTRWTAVHAYAVSTNGAPQQDLTARASAVDYAAGTVTVTLSKAAPANTFITVDF